MGPLLDLAVVGLAILVSLTLLLLAWTLGISAVRAVRKAQDDVILARLQLTVVERALLRRFGPGTEGDE